MVKEVYVGGLGCVSALGKGVGIQLEKLIAAESGLGNLSLFDTNHRVVVGEVKHSTGEMADMLGLRSDKGYSRTTVLGLMAAKEALEDSGVNPAG
ncbi:MAG: beta-ketoacyl-[acyl-carrier-protein] synthase family protein, partial [Bacteroidales bacterium]|nr:beta-ketoacyl-[acyl-carrier-protein] synthase family protein [Bacteroidales bacterium]